MKDKKSAKKATKDGTLKSSKSSSQAPPLSPHSSGMPGPAPIDNPAFDKLHHIQKDWAQREWIETVNGSMKRIVDFLNKFGTTFALHLQDYTSKSLNSISLEISMRLLPLFYASYAP